MCYIVNDLWYVMWYEKWYEYIYMLFIYFLSSNFSFHSGWNWIIIVSVFSFLFFLYSLVSLLTCFPTHLFPYPLVSLPTCFPTHLFPYSLATPTNVNRYPTPISHSAPFSKPEKSPRPFLTPPLSLSFLKSPRPFLTLPLYPSLKNPHARFSLSLSL